MASKAPLVERLRGLVERLEKLEGPDREVDFWISARVFDPSDETDEALQADIDLVGIEGMVIDAPFTASIDAAVALVERVLPGWRWAMTTAHEHTAASVRDKSILAHDKIEGDGYHPTPAIALLIANLRALSQEQSK